MTTPSLSPFTRIVGSLFFVLALCFLVGCDSPSSTIREIRRNLDTFKSSPNLQTKEALEKSFAKMEVQIQELEAKGDTVQYDLFRRQSFTLRYDFHSTLLEIAKWNSEEAERRANAQAPVTMPSPEARPSVPPAIETHKE